MTPAVPDRAGRQHGEVHRRRHRRPRDRSASSGTSPSTSAPGRPEVASEIELAPNRKPYFDDEDLEGPRLDRRPAAGRAPARRVRHRPAAVLAGRAVPDGGRDRGRSTTSSSAVARSSSRPPTEGGYNCAGCHGPRASAASRRRSRSPTPTASSSPRVTWQAPALNTVLLRFSEDEVQRHPHLRPARHADAGVGRRRRRSAHHPADRRADRLPRLDPDHLRGGPGPGRGGPPRGARPRRGRRHRLRRPGRGRGAVQPRPRRTRPRRGRRRFSCARCHTKGASLVAGSRAARSAPT